MSILLLPTIAGIFPVFPVIESTENRAMKEFPEISYSKLDSFPAEFDEFYADNVTFRNHLLKWNSHIKFHWFSIPPFTDKAFMGNNGWMFAVKDEMDHYLGNTAFTADTLNRFIEIIKYRKRFLDSLNCKYYLVIVPIKASIYPEYIPLSKRMNVDETLTDQIVGELRKHPELNFVDLRDELLNHKDGYRLFHKTDNHWNEYGGYVAYRTIMNKLGDDYPSLQAFGLENFEIETNDSEGKVLTNLMGVFDGVQEQEILLKPLLNRVAYKGEKQGYPVPNYFPYKNSYEKVFITDNKKQPKLLVIQDSFGPTLVPFLSEHFSKSVYIFDAWQHELNEDIVLNEKPDIYIQLVMESLLANIPKNAKRP